MLEASIPAVLHKCAGQRPNETAFTFIDYEQDPAGVAQSLTWSQVYRRTLNVAEKLKQCGSPGDRAVVLAPQGLDYVIAFLGAMEAGQIAVPLSAPQGGASDERASAVLLDAAPTSILTTSAVAGSVAECIEPGQSAPSLIELDLLDLDAEIAPASDTIDLPEIAYLQYTSGSTRTPAGVEISHKNMLVNIEQILSSYFRDEGGVAPPDTTVVSWLPLFHDMGLIVGIGIPLVVGCPAVLASPPAFLQRPARWMQLVASATRPFTAGPNIAFELAAAKTSDDDLAGLDLGHVRNILNGAERVQPATLERFAKRFARFNLDPKALRPSYGLAEATVYVATREQAEPPEVVYFDSAALTAGHATSCPTGEGTPLVSYGTPRSPIVRIVDPETRIECPAGTVGEIWTHGDNVSTGYWQKPEESERTFGAALVDPSAGTPTGPWLRTGDLGFLYDDELFIIGRIKDLLIVYGRNHSPDDIEATIQEISAGRCVAISVPDDAGTEKLVAIVELKVRADSEEAATQKITGVKRKLTSAIAKAHGLSVADLVLVGPHSIPLTTSGKVRRRECLQRYQHDEFTRIDAHLSRPPQRAAQETDAREDANSGLAQRLRALRKQQHDLLVGVVCAQAAAVLGLASPDDIDPEGAFQDLGFDSVKATELLDRLKSATELELAPTLAFDYPTPAALGDYLGELLSGSVAKAPAVVSREVVNEPVAVVGMACRFPGGVDSAAALWDLVAAGTDAMGGFPTDRGWNLSELFDDDPDAVGKTYTRVGGFLAGAGGFDTEFFGISPREAQAMDPQQRLLLEVCWEALETARIDPVTLGRSQTGVFVGAWSQRYGADGSDGAEGYAMTGQSTSVVSGRVAYALGLQGPAITVDTACSSSLVATHLACQSLRNGESSLALAGGVTVMTTPMVFTEFARQRGLALDGRCKAFAAGADGTGWGEGAAVLVLERLSDAQRNNHPVLAVIAGSAINQDGPSNGLTAPNGPAQQSVIRQAGVNAGVGLNEVDVVEAHGTGTTLGDPIEAGALLATYGAHRDADQPLWLGSVKSNIGHTQAAAGAAGLIKMVEAVNHDFLPPTMHVDEPSPYIDWSAGSVRLLTESVPWPDTGRPRTAAVSSFGISGTNAHIIVQQSPVSPETSAGPAAASSVLDPLLVWPVSARSPQALAAQAHRLREYLGSHPELGLADVAYSLASTRTQHPYRATIASYRGSADPRQDLLSGLEALTVGLPHPRLAKHHNPAHQLGAETVFVFPGQGAQYPGMGLDLYEQLPVFARSLDRCDAALRPFTGWSVIDVLRQDPAAPSLERVDVVQPVLFAIMVSLAESLAAYGIVADAVIGHSQGEIAAAYVAGALSLADAAKIAALRSQALTVLSGSGGMASIVLPAEEVRPRLQSWDGALSIAAVNGPSHTIVSGDRAALEQLTELCTRDNIQIRPIAVDYASHGSQVQRLRDQLVADLAGLTAQPARIPLYSTVESMLSDQPLDTTVMNADYWYRNLREPVRFHDNVIHLLDRREHLFVEISPHPVLAAAITDTLGGTADRPGSAVLTPLHRDRPDLETLATTLGQLHNHGHSPMWRNLYPDAQTVALPTYAFQHRIYWATPTPTTSAVSDAADDALWKAVDNDGVDAFAQLLELDGTQDEAALGDVVRALRRWHYDTGARTAADKLRYRVDWRAVTPNTFGLTRRRWVVLAFPDQIEDDWITGLSAGYPDAVDVHTVDRSAVGRESLAALLRTAAAHCDGVVSFLAAGAQVHPDPSSISAGLTATLLLAQAHGDAGLGIPLWVITRGAVSVSTDDGPPNPTQSAAWGLGQSVCLEDPDQWGGLIDLPPKSTPRDLESLYAILSCPQKEDQLAIRSHGISARRLVQAPLPSKRLARGGGWQPSGAALVTGATGRLGKHLIGWLADAGANPLLLLSRNATADPQLAELEAELQARGVTTASVSVDVSDRSALADALADLRSIYGPIGTVVHAAAAIGWNSISDTTAEELSDSCAAKVGGAINLVELLDDEPETFILFSSAAATWGGAQQGAYAAANAAIDALAERLRCNGRRAVAPAYGLWADEASNMPAEVLDSFRRIGINPIPPTTALAALRQAIEVDDTLITLADVSWDRFVPALTARRLHPLLTELAPRVNTSESSSALSSGDAHGLREKLVGQTAEERLQTLTTIVARATATVLAHPDPVSLDTETAFKDLGIDSLTAMELRNTLTAQTGLTLPANLVFEHPTPGVLANHLASQLASVATPTIPAGQLATRGAEPVDNLLAYLDQAAFLATRAVHGALIQVTWIYDRGADMEGLRRFHRNLGSGPFGRTVERSPIPFARDRWVLAPRLPDLEIATTPRRRADVSAWADERARLPIDPEWGPGWHLGVLPLEDGGTAVSLVVSHAVVDAIGFGQAIAEAAEGKTHELRYPPARSRTRRQALREDLRQTVKELPAVGHALAAVARRARRDRKQLTSSIKTAPPARRTAGVGDQAVEMPALTARIDLAEWDTRAKKLGASGNSLVAGVACRLAVRMGRVTDDGSVTLRLVANLRTDGDTRGNAITAVDVAVDPTHAATDLRDVHHRITQTILEAMDDADNEWLAPLPLTAMTPKRVARRLAGVAAGGPSLPVTVSNIGDLPPAVNRPDGTDADHAHMRPFEPGMKMSTLERMGGQLLFVSGRDRGQVFIRISAYLLGRPNTKEGLQEAILSTFAEFGLIPEIDW
ncbi:type I polyketide synthase [Mycobacterium vicinigordonae]|uniref:SDR family NAD(P)-dependent oxidoreductase n=1 Tax=Mycobacterium vicinigordonae TaxID=1719132 RepID=A0A7D6E2E1_9MYCO|nr:type I polyketide synthase [Mycobacterium vicinigordonae]QLL09629.1 SDR family NAD(P)-dependent oxidoreductase [Mycobacterium vicinigordonae]